MFKIFRREGLRAPVNHKLVDWWSGAHVVSGTLMAWVMDPLVAFILMALYEPIEVYLLYPAFLRKFGFVFGNEGLRNSLVDLFFNLAGILVGFYILRELFSPPFTLL